MASFHSCGKGEWLVKPLTSWFFMVRCRISRYFGTLFSFASTGGDDTLAEGGVGDEVTSSFLASSGISCEISTPLAAISGGASSMRLASSGIWVSWSLTSSGTWVGISLSSNSPPSSQLLICLKGGEFVIPVFLNENRLSNEKMKLFTYIVDTLFSVSKSGDKKMI
ncbi:hypothetical protein GEMRC1_012440 [Eukaryota sp. GEM-RC1]